MSFNFLSFFPLSFCISCLNLHVLVSGYFSYFFFFSENAKETKRSTNVYNLSESSVHCKQFQGFGIVVIHFFISIITVEYEFIRL